MLAREVRILSMLPPRQTIFDTNFINGMVCGRSRSKLVANNFVRHIIIPQYKTDQINSWEVGT